MTRCVDVKVRACGGVQVCRCGGECVRGGVELQMGVQVWRCENEEFCKCGMSKCVQAWICGSEAVRRCRGVEVRCGADVEM